MELSPSLAPYGILSLYVTLPFFLSLPLSHTLLVALFSLSEILIPGIQLPCCEEA